MKKRFTSLGGKSAIVFAATFMISQSAGAYMLQDDGDSDSDDSEPVVLDNGCCAADRESEAGEGSVSEAEAAPGETRDQPEPDTEAEM